MATIFRLVFFIGLSVSVLGFFRKKDPFCFDDPIYEDLKCFELEPSCHDREPSDPLEIGTTFTVFSVPNTEHGDLIDRKDDLTIINSCFDGTKPTNLIVHGWTDSMISESWVSMKNALIYTENFNVIMVDWNEGADKFYYKSRANTRVVGRDICLLIAALNKVTGAPFESMHIIGHSLGAHIGGYAGEFCNHLNTTCEETGRCRIGRVTGLDPAGPDFSGDDRDPACRLDPTDALFVDVMHTDGEHLVGGGAGLMDQLGDQDFYPNAGQEMPGCGAFDASCDHSRAVEYFIESIYSACLFTSSLTSSKWQEMADGYGTPCTSENPCPEMGFHASPYMGTGAYYLQTSDQYPYCQ